MKTTSVQHCRMVFGPASTTLMIVNRSKHGRKDFQDDGRLRQALPASLGGFSAVWHFADICLSLLRSTVPAFVR